ncbi:hypothetical protein C0992_011512, partial [Termitomyces sp. T32_za158]
HVDCVFEGLQEGSQHNSAICEACQEKHKGCLVACLWQACCVAAEQGWDIDWMWRKMGKGLRPQVMEVPGGGPMAVEGIATPVSTPCSRPDEGKRKAVLELEVPKRVHWQLSPVPPAFEGGPLGSNVFSLGSGHLLPSITICQGVLEILHAEAGRLWAEVEVLHKEARVARQEHDKAVWARVTLLHNHDTSFELWEVQTEEIKQLQASLMREAVGSSARVPEFAAPSAQEFEELAWGLHQVD